MTRLIRDQLPALSQRGRLRRLLSHIVFVLTVSTSSGTTTSFLPPFQSFRPITPIHKPGEVLAHVDGSVRVLRHQIVMRVRDDIDPRLPKRVAIMAAAFDRRLPIHFDADQWRPPRMAEMLS
jgi:hypothetical protein